MDSAILDSQAKSKQTFCSIDLAPVDIENSGDKVLLALLPFRNIHMNIHMSDNRILLLSFIHHMKPSHEPQYYDA